MTGSYVVPVEDTNTIARHLAAQAERHGSKVFVKFPRENRSISYQSLLATSEAATPYELSLKNELICCGVRPV